MEERVLFSRLQVFRRVGDSGQKARVYKLISRKLLDGWERDSYRAVSMSISRTWLRRCGMYPQMYPHRDVARPVCTHNITAAKPELCENSGVRRLRRGSELTPLLCWGGPRKSNGGVEVRLSMESLDYWRFCDELTVVQAALLIVDQDPSGIAEYVQGWHPVDKPTGYAAVFSALQLSIIGERLEATTTFRSLDYQHPDVEHPINRVDWQATRVGVDDLKAWLEARGVQSGFFFPVGPVTAEYLDTKNESFAPKLAAAVQAWKAVQQSELPTPR